MQFLADLGYSQPLRDVIPLLAIENLQPPPSPDIEQPIRQPLRGATTSLAIQDSQPLPSPSHSSSPTPLVDSVDETTDGVVGPSRHGDDFEFITSLVDPGDGVTGKPSLSEILRWKKENDLISGWEVVTSPEKSRTADKTVEETEIKRQSHKEMGEKERTM